MNFDTFQYKNIEPTDDLKAFANRCLERMREAAPYLATFVPRLEFDGTKYKCTIELYSHWGNYSAASSTYFPEAAILWAEHKINSQLWRWKEKRFSNFKATPDFLFSKPDNSGGSSGWGNESRN